MMYYFLSDDGISQEWRIIFYLIIFFIIINMNMPYFACQPNFASLISLLFFFKKNRLMIILLEILDNS